MSLTIPTYVGRLSLDKFTGFMTHRGAAALEPTNEWEVLRVIIHGETEVLYQNKTGSLTWTPALEDAYRCYKRGKVWTGVDKHKRQNKRPPIVRAIIARDGLGCWYCASDDDMTLEHMLEIAKGGSNHLFNLVLACDRCNKAVMNLSVSEKVVYRESKRSV